VFRIYYSDSVYQGRTVADWIDAPGDDVQVVMVEGPHPVNIRDARERHGYVYCRSRWPLYTGADHYDPLETGNLKLGRQLSDQVYFAIWGRAYGDATA